MEPIDVTLYYIFTQRLQLLPTFSFNCDKSIISKHYYWIGYHIYRRIINNFNKKNRSGSRTDPWATPKLLVYSAVKCYSISHKLFNQIESSWLNQKTLPWIPFNTSYSKWSHSVSNALERLKNICSSMRLWITLS